MRQSAHGVMHDWIFGVPCCHWFMKAQLRISVKDYSQNKSREIQHSASARAFPTVL